MSNRYLCDRKAEGSDSVTGVTIAEVDKTWKVVPGTEKNFDVDTICVAVGLNPMSQMLQMAGCVMEDRGGMVPVCNQYGETSISGIFAAGDVSGIEEASSAMIGGHIAGIAAAYYGKFIDKEELEEKYETFSSSLKQLRQGMFAPENRGRTDIVETEEGVAISQNLLAKGYVADEEMERYPGVTHQSGIHPVIECTQNIPCNPCQDACKFGCIKIGEKITSLPVVDIEKECKNCGLCVASCSGQAIFLVDEDCGDGTATITLPYELLPLPKEGDTGKALNRKGEIICDAQVVSIKSATAFDKTHLLTMRVAKEYAMVARFFKKA